MCYYAATAPRPPNMITPPHTTAVMCRRHMFARNPRLRSDSDGRGLVHPNQRSACQRYAYSTNHAFTQQASSRSTTAHQRCNAPAACRRYAFIPNPRLRSDSDGRGLRATTRVCVPEVRVQHQPRQKKCVAISRNTFLIRSFFIGLGHISKLVEVVFHTNLEFPALSVVLDVRPSLSWVNALVVSH